MLKIPQKKMSKIGGVLSFSSLKIGLVAPICSSLSTDNSIEVKSYALEGLFGKGYNVKNLVYE